MTAMTPSGIKSIRFCIANTTPVLSPAERRARWLRRAEHVITVAALVFALGMAAAYLVASKGPMP